MASSDNQNEFKPNPISEGTPVFVTGTKHHGFRGRVVQAVRKGGPYLVALEEWQIEGLVAEHHKFYTHQLIPFPDAQAR